MSKSKKTNTIEPPTNSKPTSDLFDAVNQQMQEAFAAALRWRVNAKRRLPEGVQGRFTDVQWHGRNPQIQYRRVPGNPHRIDVFAKISGKERKLSTIGTLEGDAAQALLDQWYKDRSKISESLRAFCCQIIEGGALDVVDHMAIANVAIQEFVRAQSASALSKESAAQVMRCSYEDVLDSRIRVNSTALAILYNKGGFVELRYGFMATHLQSGDVYFNLPKKGGYARAFALWGKVRNALKEMRGFDDNGVTETDTHVRLCLRF